MAEKKNTDEFQWLEIDLSDLLFVVRRHFGKLILIPLFAAILGFSVSRVLPPVFSATSVIFLRPNFDKEIQLEQTSSKLDDADSLRSIEQALVSDSVILATVETLGLREDLSFLGETAAPDEPLTDSKLLKKIRKRFEAKLKPNTRTVVLSVEDFSAERTVVLAETLVDEFLNRFREDRNAKEAELRRSLIEQAEKALKGALAMEEKLKDFRSRNPDTIVEQDSSIFHDRLLASGSALNAANSELSQLAGMVDVLKSVDPEKDPFQVFQIVSNRNREYLSDLLAMHADAKADMAVISQKRQEQHPDYQEAASRLEEVEATLRRYAVEMKSGVTSEYQAATEKVVKLNETLSGLRGDFVGLKTKSAEFRGLKEEMDRNWNTYAQLQQKVMDLDLNPEVSPTFITVVSDPVVPHKKIKPRGMLYAAGGGLFGLLIVAGLIAWPFRSGIPFTASEQAVSYLSLPTIGTVGMKSASARGSDRGSSFDGVPSGDLLNLLISLRDSQVVHLTSLIPDQSADEVSRLLASQCAVNGAKTLEVSFPDSSPFLGTIQPTDTVNLFILELPLEALVKPENFLAGLERVRGDYDRIFVNTMDLDSVEAKVATTALVDRTAIAVIGEDLPRGTYREFVERCQKATDKPMAFFYRTRGDSASDRKQASRLRVSKQRRHHQPPKPKGRKKFWNKIGFKKAA